MKAVRNRNGSAFAVLQRVRVAAVLAWLFVSGPATGALPHDGDLDSSFGSLGEVFAYFPGNGCPLQEPCKRDRDRQVPLR